MATLLIIIFVIFAILAMVGYSFYKNERIKKDETHLERGIFCENYFPFLTNGHKRGLEQVADPLPNGRTYIQFQPTDGKSGERYPIQDFAIPTAYRKFTGRGEGGKHQHEVKYLPDDIRQVPDHLKNNKILNFPKIIEENKHNKTILEMEKAKSKSDLKTMRSITSKLPTEEATRMFEFHKKVTEATSPPETPKPTKK